MREEIETQFGCSIIDWNVPIDDLGNTQWSALVGGRLILADSFALLLSALQDQCPQALMLAA